MTRNRLAIGDGGVEPAGIAEHEKTRRAAVRRGLVLAGGAVAASSIPLLGVRNAFARTEGDAAILERAIELEQRAVVAYRTAAGGDLFDAEVATAAELFARQEQEHVDALSAALADLGGTAPKPARAADVAGLDELGSQAEALEFLIELENMTVVAYDEAATRLEAADLLKTTAQIVSNEAQHLVVLRQQLGIDPVPGPFETGTEGATRE